MLKIKLKHHQPKNLFHLSALVQRFCLFARIAKFVSDAQVTNWKLCSWCWDPSCWLCVCMSCCCNNPCSRSLKESCNGTSECFNIACSFIDEGELGNCCIYCSCCCDLKAATETSSCFSTFSLGI